MPARDAAHVTLRNTMLGDQDGPSQCSGGVGLLKARSRIRTDISHLRRVLPYPVRPCGLHMCSRRQSRCLWGTRKEYFCHEASLTSPSSAPLKSLKLPHFVLTTSTLVRTRKGVRQGMGVVVWTAVGQIRRTRNFHWRESVRVTPSPSSAWTARLFPLSALSRVLSSDGLCGLFAGFGTAFALRASCSWSRFSRPFPDLAKYSRISEASIGNLSLAAQLARLVTGVSLRAPSQRDDDALATSLNSQESRLADR